MIVSRRRKVRPSAGQRQRGSRAKNARRPSRLIAQGLRSSETSPKKRRVEKQKQSPPRAVAPLTPEGSLPMLSSEPAPSSPRPWASAQARPLADKSTLTRAASRLDSKGTFPLRRERKRLGFALKLNSSRLSERPAAW
jgi:hypothetical protein